MSEANPVNPSDVPPQPAPEAQPAVPPVATTEGLPVYEPLTPEMVEDEAVRGDFVMKWAVILLAVLFGCTVITETSTLVHTKAGQYLASHGFLPPAHDVFSSTGEQLSWVNLTWLFDLVLAAVYGIGSFVGLSVLKAILAGIAFGLICHTSRPGVSTWFGSICAGLAVLASQPRLTAQPELITLLGIALTLWLLHRWLWSPDSRKVWMLVLVTIVWSNLDDRAWWGPILLLLYGAGEYLGSMVGRPVIQTPMQRKTLWMVIGAACVGLMFNPFLWNSWLAPVVQFGTEYPAKLIYYPHRLAMVSQDPHRLESLPLTDVTLWFSHQVPLAAAALLFLTAAMLIVINRRRLDFGHLLMLIGAAVPAILASHELAAAAIVFCVVASLNGQSWYGATSTSDYSTETRALLFSRGGRAVTVLALFSLALLFTVGRLRPSGTGSVGLGLDPDLEGAIKSYQTVLKDSIDNRPFNFTVEQGDVLIWIDQRPFIDQRLAVFAGHLPKSDGSVIDLHMKLRLALSPKQQGAVVKPTDRKFWRDEFDRFKITHCLPRLGGNTPDYATFGDLLFSPDWQFVRLGSATAVFYRRDLDQPDLKEFLTKSRFDMGDSFFKTELELLSPRAGWAQLPTFYQRYIWKTATRPSPEVREARHLVELVANIAGGRGVGLVYQAIRKAQESLAKDPNDAAAYEILGRAYMQLITIETQAQMTSPTAQLRYLQAVQAFNLALIAGPDNPQVHQILFQLYMANNRVDLALREVDALYRFLDAQIIQDPEQDNLRIQQLERTATEMDRIHKIITQVDNQAKKLPKEVTTDHLQMAYFYYQNGLPLKALEQLPPVEDAVKQSPQEMGLRAELLLEVGRAEEAYETAGQLEGLAQLTGYQDWRRTKVATLLGNAEYTAAAQIWRDQGLAEEQSAMAGVLGTLVPRHFGFVGRPWPVSTTAAAAKYYFVTPGTTSSLNTYAALIYLEAGQIKRAIEYFRLALKQNPDHAERGMVAFYLEKMTGQWVDYVPPSDRVPIEFAPE